MTGGELRQLGTRNGASLVGPGSSLSPGEIVWQNDQPDDNPEQANGKIGGRLEMGGDAPVCRKILFIEQAVNLVPQFGGILRMDAFTSFDERTLRVAPMPAAQVIPIEVIAEHELKKNDARIKADNAAINGKHHAVGKPDHQRGRQRRGNHQGLAGKREAEIEQQPEIGMRNEVGKGIPQIIGADHPHALLLNDLVFGFVMARRRNSFLRYRLCHSDHQPPSLAHRGEFCTSWACHAISSVIGGYWGKDW